MTLLHFFVFSFNRGEFLANCVRSIDECAPDAALTVIDDQSTDLATRNVLESIGQRHEVVHAGAEGSHKHGGLYGNMQAALELASDETIACFLQDDTQLVRGLDPTEVGTLAHRFSSCDELGFISPCFFRGRTWKRNRGMRFDYDGDLDLFFAQPTGRSAGIQYSDVCIAHIGRLRMAGWRFATGEPANQRFAAARFGRMGYLPRPFAMWLPNVPTYRGRTKSLALRWAEASRDCGLHPIRYLSPADVERLERATAAHPPIAEDWLEPIPEPVSTPWTYDPMQGSRWLKQLDRAELLARAAARALIGRGR